MQRNLILRCDSCSEEVSHCDTSLLQQPCPSYIVLLHHDDDDDDCDDDNKQNYDNCEFKTSTTVNDGIAAGFLERTWDLDTDV